MPKQASTAAIILAAGKGTRMRSKLPKVLHPVGGAPLVGHVVQTALDRKCDPIVVVVGEGAMRVREVLTARFPEAPLKFVTQEKQLGTGHATKVGLGAIPQHQGPVLILYGDTPLLTSKTIARLQRAAARGKTALLTAVVPDPTGYGRVVREGKDSLRIVEHKDCTAEQRQIHEINVGVYVVAAPFLREVLGGLKRSNEQKEYYLTDIAQAGPTVPVVAEDLREIQGINDRMQLAEAEAYFREQRILSLMERGVTVQAPNHLWLDAEVTVEPEAVLGVNVQLRGRTTIKRGAIIEGPTVIKDSLVESQACVHAFSHLEHAVVRKGAQVGPYARLRPEAEVGPEAKVGNFVEIKKSRLGKGAKASHLAYLGDTEVGPGANVGAGTITCNYDGAAKHRTEIGKGVFVGSNSTLVAPVKLKAGSYIAAGSTITNDVEKDALAFGRARQHVRNGYAKKIRQRQLAAKKPHE